MDEAPTQEVLDQFFVGDLVSLKSKAYSVGTVTRIAWMADSDDEHWEYFSDYSDEDVEAPLKENHVEVLWNNLKLSEVHVGKLKVIDRGLVHGDIAASVKEPTGQTCTVTDVVLSVDLMLVKSGHRVSNVLPKYLTDIHPYMIGRHVTRKNQPKMVGTIDDVICDVECKFPDNSRCVLRKATPRILKIMEDDVSDDEIEPERNYLYYPSQTVAATKAVWDSAEWLVKGKSDNRQKKAKQRIQATVTKVTPVCVVVYWHKQVENKNLEEEVAPQDLILLHQFRHTQFSVGDYAMIHPVVRDHFLASTVLNIQPAPPKGAKGKKAKNRQAFKAAIQKKANQTEPEQPTESTEAVLSNVTSNHETLAETIEGWTGTESEVAVITATHTHVKVQWQDGSSSPAWMHSTELIPRKHLLECDFWPGKFVMSPNTTDTGVIESVNSKDKTAKVRWLVKTETPENSTELSVYDIKEPQNKRFRLGGCVKSLQVEDVGEVLELKGDQISVAWSSTKIATVNQADLEAIDTDDEDEGPDDEEREYLRKRELKLLQSLKSGLDDNQEPVIPKMPEIDEERAKLPTVGSFTLLDNCDTHHFKDQAIPPKLGRIIAGEWQKLSSGLPQGIHVVTYGDRMDLLKALIVGPSETVFYNSFFIFDIGLPVDYPLSPPKVHYNSCGAKINPNLYEDGTVCLSLLGTWSGESTERWHALTSSILQLVVSIQGLILGVKEPYFLEAGYDKLQGTKQGTLSSRVYNERSLILSLKMMCQYFTHPPFDFQTVLGSELATTSPEVLMFCSACQKILDGKPLTDAETAVTVRYNMPAGPSRGFLLMAKEISSSIQKVQKA